ncbi:MAG: WD40 repeat domain-containing protein [Trueperaceae bacterium]
MNPYLTYLQPKRLEPTWVMQIDGYVRDLMWSPDGQKIAVAAAESTLFIFKASSGEVLTRYTGHALGTETIAWSPNGKRLASGGQDGYVRVWGVDGEVASVRLGSWVQHLAWSKEGNVLAVAAGKQLYFLDADGDVQEQVATLPNTLTALAWHPTKFVLAVGAYNRVWMMTPHKLNANEKQEGWACPSPPLLLRWHPQGHYLAGGTTDAVYLWPAKQPEKLMHMTGYFHKVTALAWDSSGRYLSTGGAPEIAVWDCGEKQMSGMEPILLELHSDLVTDLAQQGRVLASAGRDHTVGIWHVPDENYQSVAMLDAPVTKVAWQPNKNVLATGCENGTVAVWKV